MLAHQIARIAQAKHIDHIVVATSNETSDDVIETLCHRLDIDCYRGSLNDVLDRYYQASVQYAPTHVVRLTGDCPLIDADIIDNIIELHISTNADYTSNCAPATFPDGLDAEVLTFATLKKVWQQAKKPSEREHVTPYVHNNTHLFNRENYTYHQDLTAYRWTVDEPEDFEFVKLVYKALYPKKPYFTFTDVLDLLKENPKLTTINQGFTRNEGLLKSQQLDQELGYE